MSDHAGQSKCFHLKGCIYSSVPNRTSNVPELTNGHIIYHHFCAKCTVSHYVCEECNRRSKVKNQFNRYLCVSKNGDNLPKQHNRRKYTTLNLEPRGSTTNCHVQNIKNPNNNDNNVVKRHGEFSSDEDNSCQYNFDTCDNHDQTYDNTDCTVHIESYENDNSQISINDDKVITNLIQTTDWGNESSTHYFANEHHKEQDGLHSIVSRATKRPYEANEDDEHIKRDTDYHVFGACFFSSLTRNQTIMCTKFIQETIRREKEEQKTSEISPRLVRRTYTEGPRSIYMNMPVPIAKPGGKKYDDFAILSVEHAADHLLAHGVPLKSLDYNEVSDWKDNDSCFHSLFHNELFVKIGKLENRPDNLQIHQFYIWSDGFQKNTLVKKKSTSLQLFTIYFVPPDGTRDIAKYTFPFALGQKQQQHQSILNLVLQQAAALKQVRSRYCGILKAFVNVYFELVIVQNDYIERMNNLNAVQSGSFGKWYGYSAEFNNSKTFSCTSCINVRIENLYRNIQTRESTTTSYCTTCSDWWKGFDKNPNGFMDKPIGYPTTQDTIFGDSAPTPPAGRCITDSINLPPCKLSFSFLIKAFLYAKYHYLKGDWTQLMTTTYLRTCCVGGDLIKNLIQNRAEAVVPDLWLRHEEYGVQIESFPDAPMHMLFLGITKHLLGNVDRLFNKKKIHYREFCTIISAHQKCGNKLSIDWCNISQFSDKEAITTTSWQSDQYLAFSRMSLVYFGLLEEYSDELDDAQINAFQQVFVLWFMLLSALFNENKPNSRLVDDCVRLFLSACIYYGETTIQVVSDKKTKGRSKGKAALKKKGRSKGKAAFFEDTTNYFSLLNLKLLIERFGSIRMLWEGEREKFIKYIKREMTTICATESYMPNVLNKFLRTNQMNELLKTNQLHEEMNYTKTRNFTVYGSYEDLRNNFETGIMLSGVIMKSPADGKEDIFVCYKCDTSNAHVLHRIDFYDTGHKTKLFLHYAAIKLTDEVGKCFLINFENREQLLKAISGYVIIHPMVTKDMKFRISNGHTVLTNCWRVRTVEGIYDFLPNVSGFVFH